MSTAPRRSADDRHRPFVHQQAEEGEAVHAGHLQIQRHHVRRARGDEFLRRVGVDGRADDLDLGVGAERGAHQPADDRGVVDHQDANAAAEAHESEGRR
jgi:hypothetical protein